MQCASKYVNLNKRRTKVVEFDARADLFSAAPSVQPQGQAKRREITKADTNIVAARLGTLTEDVAVATGDPVFCDCGAVFNALSELKPYEPSTEVTTTTTGDNFFSAGDKVWTCEFCGAKKAIVLDDEEKPTAESIDYIIEPPSEDETMGSVDDSIIIFCIDISGSMCVTTEVVGKLKLRGNDASKLAALNTEGVSQYRPSDNRNTTYVSRLQAVVAAVDAQLEVMEKEHPNRRVGLVTFNREVTIVGDGTQHPQTVTGDKLFDYSELLNIGTAFDLATPIKASRKELEKRLFDLEEMGPTALGPALVVSVGMASKSKGSKVVICTDGCSNVGVGSLDELKTEKDQEAAEKFYREVADLALLNGTTISVISIKGDSCRMEELGVLADRTNGDVDIVDPLNITKNFSSILSLPILATHVSVKLLVHKGLYLRQEGEEVEASKAVEGRSFIEQDIGNVTSESEVTFEFGVRENVEEGLKSLPFQMQIRYQKLNGMKCIRVISQVQAVTYSDEEAEQEADLDILGLNATRNAARFAQQGNYAYARLYNAENADLMDRAARTEKQLRSKHAWSCKQKALEEHLNNDMVIELDEGVELDDDDVSVEKGANEKEKRSKADMRNKMRKAKRNDSTANVLYQLASTDAKKYTK